MTNIQKDKENTRTHAKSRSRRILYALKLFEFGRVHKLYQSHCFVERCEEISRFARVDGQQPCKQK